MSQRHVDDESGQLQCETGSPQTVQCESTSWTAVLDARIGIHESGVCEVNANVNTPRKILVMIFPIPENS
jgi:hypothetical protein